jgi:hypothetical protein
MQLKWMIGHLESSLQVNSLNKIPIIVGRFSDRSISQDAGVVDDDIDAAEVVDRGFNQSFAVLDRIVVGNGLSTCDN